MRKETNLALSMFKRKAKSFSPDTPVSDIMEWATGDKEGRDNPLFEYSFRRALFRIELSAPKPPMSPSVRSRMERRKKEEEGSASF